MNRDWTHPGLVVHNRWVSIQDLTHTPDPVLPIAVPRVNVVPNHVAAPRAKRAQSDNTLLVCLNSSAVAARPALAVEHQQFGSAASWSSGDYGYTQVRCKIHTLQLQMGLPMILSVAYYRNPM